MSFFSRFRSNTIGMIRAKSETVIGSNGPVDFDDKNTLRNSGSVEFIVSPLQGRRRSRSVFTKPPAMEKELIEQELQSLRESAELNISNSKGSTPNALCFRDELYEASKQDKDIEIERYRAWNPVLNEYLSTSKEESSRKLIVLIRKGVPDILKPQVWKAVSGTSDFLQDNPGFFSSMTLLVFGPKLPNNFRHVPSFGGVISPSDHFLSHDGLLSMVAMSFPELDYCPVLPDIIIICLMFLSEAETGALLHVLIDNSKKLPMYYLNTSVKEFARFTLIFDQKISRHLWSLHKRVDVAKDIAEGWFSRMFVSYLPYQTVLRIFDVYMNEGSKILYKTGLAILHIIMPKLLSTSNSHEFMRVLHKNSLKLFDADLLIKTAYKFRLKNHLFRLDKKAMSLIESLQEPYIPVYYRPKTPPVSSTIPDDLYEILWAWIPRRFCIQDPFLVFSTDIHGCSLSTFYHLCGSVSPSILSIRTKNGSIFGAYLSDPWLPYKSERPVYYGDGECFIFSLVPTINHWPWSRANEYFMLAAHDHIAVGGGSGSALWLDHAFDFCMTSACETFNSPPLDPHDEFLGSVTVEVFGFQ